MLACSNVDSFIADDDQEDDEDYREDSQEEEEDGEDGEEGEEGEDGDGDDDDEEDGGVAVDEDEFDSESEVHGDSGEFV